MPRSTSFEISRRAAYKLLGDAEDEIRNGDWTDTIPPQRVAIRMAIVAIGYAKDALNKAAPST